MKKLRRSYKAVVGELAMWWMWVKNLCFVFLTTKSKIRIFTGYGHWWLAKKYADRRYDISKVNKYCGGKRHYVLPYGDYSLIVLNSLELQNLKKRGFFSKAMNIALVLKNAYYVTQ
jgi:expansin (peptidoglycan-binding protein)